MWESLALAGDKVAKSVHRSRTCARAMCSPLCRALGIGHVTPHGLRSYFVTQARESGLSDAEIAMLIGDKTGPAIIAHTYGDVRPDHLLKQAQRIRLTVQARRSEEGQGVVPNVVPCRPMFHEVAASRPEP